MKTSLVFIFAVVVASMLCLQTLIVDRLDCIERKLDQRPVTRELAIGPGASYDAGLGIRIVNPGTQTMVFAWSVL